MVDGRQQPVARARQDARNRRSLLAQLAFSMMAIGLLIAWWVGLPGQQFIGARMECLLNDDFEAVESHRCLKSLARTSINISGNDTPSNNEPAAVVGVSLRPGLLPDQQLAAASPVESRPPGSLIQTTTDLSPAHRCLSLNIYWEARNQPYAGQLAVAQVTMNRVKDRRFPDDVCEVVYDHKQFSWYWDGKTDRPRDQRAWETSVMIASAAIQGTGNAELEGVTHYHAVYSQPYWKNHMAHVATIGDHIFYSEKRGSQKLSTPSAQTVAAQAD